MHKVVIERPRWNPGPGKKGRRANLSDELLPKFEGIKRPHLRRKGLTDLLGPLKRWLRSQVGRPWNDVYSEACAVIKPDSIIRLHVKTHLLQFVERHTFLREGKVCILDRSFMGGVAPVAESRYRSLFFVHPETGLLHASPEISRHSRRSREPKRPVTTHWLRKNVALQLIRGLWFECHFEVVTVDVRFRAYDHALERVVSRSQLTRQDRQYFRCKCKWQLSRRELRHYGLRNEPISGRAHSSKRREGGLKNTLCLSAGRRFWVIGHQRLAVRTRPRASAQQAGSRCDTAGWKPAPLRFRLRRGRHCAVPG
jgi:hypothetical protein